MGKSRSTLLMNWKVKFFLFLITVFIIILFPKISGVVDLAGRVLSFLDISSLKNAELVSKTWKQTISESRTWEKILESEVKFELLSSYTEIFQFFFSSCITDESEASLESDL